MRTRIKNLAPNYWALIADEHRDRNGRPRILMTIAGYHKNGYYSIQDFRYTKYQQEPYPILESDQLEAMEISDEDIPKIEKLLTCPFEIKIQKDYQSVLWSSYDGLVLVGHDKPIDKQTGAVKHHKYVWSYRAAMQKLREGKEFWKNFTGSWDESKIDNPHVQPSSLSLRKMLKELK